MEMTLHAPLMAYMLTLLSHSTDELERSRPQDALSEVEKYKTRYPKQANSPIIGALKCVALQRLGREEEAYHTFLTIVNANRKARNGNKAAAPEEMEEIPSDVVIDESALHTLGYALRPMRKLPQLMKLYENAWAADPENLELGVQVFQHAVRIHDWRTTQQISIKLISPSKDPRIAHWAAMSSYLEACQPDTPEKQRSLLLKLAQTLMIREPSTPYQNEDALLLYIKILRAIGDEEVIAALRILTPDLKTPFRPDEKSAVPLELQRESCEKQSRKERDAVRKWMTDLRFRWERWEIVEELATRELNNHNNAEAGETRKEDCWDWEAEFVRCDDLIRGSEDIPETNYKAYLSLISSLMVLLSKDDGNHLTTVRETLDGLALRFEDQERAPLLAQLEINRRLRESHVEHGDQAEAHSDDSLLMAYWTAFGHKGSVLDDLAPYLTSQSGLIETLQSAVERDATEYKEYIRQLNAYKLLQLVLPRADKANDQRKTARKQFNLYLHGARFGQGIPLTDVRPADDFALLSAQAFIAAWTIAEQQDFQDLLTAIFVLEKVVKDSPANGHARMLLLRLYRMVAAPSLLSQHVQQLKMRTFQQDTVLHIVSERGSSDYISGGDKGRAMISKLLLNSKGIYESTEREISEAMVSAFTSESYSQIPGMLKLSQRFGNSHQRFLGDLELVRQSALRDVNELMNDKAVAVENLKRDKSHIEDVRDWDLLPDYLGGDGSLSLKQQTCTGPLTDSAWIAIMSSMWQRILDPESAVKDNVLGTSEQTTYCEKQLISFADQLSRFAQECKAGDTKNADGIKGEFSAMVTTATGVQHSLPWKTMHSWSIILEAYAMLEIALSPYKPLSGKKAKKGQASGVAPEVGEAVKGIFIECKSALKTLASQATALASEDKLCPSGMLIDALKESGFAEQAESSFARQCETSIRDSRRIGVKEMAKELKKRADN
ncbi:hypothetical protein QFC22_005021 [Naganishia vaughanmartiniae]|uniref:Uncharacterized protein n=1 Tax=Naganishia vaughanmartiniae TaxID=1424756 RepID=A0ACC2WXJ5_9TREE|nr:hypothetical protein QFC22_005021 [Naganishia vaughanmartiniae]